MITDKQPNRWHISQETLHLDICIPPFFRMVRPPPWEPLLTPGLPVPGILSANIFLCCPQSQLSSALLTFTTHHLLVVVIVSYWLLCPPACPAPTQIWPQQSITYKYLSYSQFLCLQLVASNYSSTGLTNPIADYSSCRS